MSNETWTWQLGSIEGIGPCFFQVQETNKYEDDPERQIRIRHVSAYRLTSDAKGISFQVGHWPPMDAFMPGNTMLVSRLAIHWVSPVKEEILPKLEECWSHIVRPTPRDLRVVGGK